MYYLKCMKLPKTQIHTVMRHKYDILYSLPSLLRCLTNSFYLNYNCREITHFVQLAEDVCVTCN